jgi:DNA replication protein DnaC
MKFKDVVDNLNILKLDKIADCLSDYVDKVNTEKIPFLDALYYLTKLEIANIAERSSQFNIRIAHFPYYRTFEDFDFSFQPSINQEQVMELASLRFIEEKKNILLIGSPGTRKNSYSNCDRNRGCKK